MLVFVLLLVGLVEQIPLVALAGLLLVMGSQLVRPSDITSSGPGDLFTIRTMGHLVPAGHEGDAAVSAPLLHAVDHLDVATVVVCGHSGCGAMSAAIDPTPGDGSIERWMQHAGPALTALRSGHPVARVAAEQGLAEVDQLGQVNVAVAVEQVRTLLGDPPPTCG